MRIEIETQIETGKVNTITQVEETIVGIHMTTEVGVMQASIIMKTTDRAIQERGKERRGTIGRSPTTRILNVGHEEVVIMGHMVTAAAVTMEEDTTTTPHDDGLRRCILTAWTAKGDCSTTTDA